MSTWLATYNQHPLGYPGGSGGKESACNAWEKGSIPRLGRSPGGGYGNPLQYSCLEHPMDRGTWQATVHGVTEADTSEPLTLQHPPRHVCHIFNFHSVPWFHIPTFSREAAWTLIMSQLPAEVWLDSQHSTWSSPWRLWGFFSCL